MGRQMRLEDVQYGPRGRSIHAGLTVIQARGLRAAPVPTKAKVTYFQDKYLEVKLQYKLEGEWIDCFRVESTANQPLTMPNTAYLGFSAETGEVSDHFDIISVETRNMYQAPGRGPGIGRAGDQGARRGGKGRAPKAKGSWSWFFVRVFLVIAVFG